MQWVVLDAAPWAAVTPASQGFPMLNSIGVSDVLPELPSAAPSARASEDANSEDHSSSGAMYGRYLGQIHARIDRAWLRPRTAIGAAMFHCRVQVDQNQQRGVTAVTLLDCNGDTRWQLSLVHAIEQASPLPTPPEEAVFAHNVVLEFRAMTYSASASAQRYAPMTVASANDEPEERGASYLNAFQTLREVARAQKPGALKLRIEGSKVEVEPDHH